VDIFVEGSIATIGVDGVQGEARETLVKAPLIIAARSRVYQAVYKYDPLAPWKHEPVDFTVQPVCRTVRELDGKKEQRVGRNGAPEWFRGRTASLRRDSIRWKCSREWFNDRASSTGISRYGREPRRQARLDGNELKIIAREAIRSSVCDLILGDYSFARRKPDRDLEKDARREPTLNSPTSENARDSESSKNPRLWSANWLTVGSKLIGLHKTEERSRCFVRFFSDCNIRRSADVIQKYRVLVVRRSCFHTIREGGNRWDWPIEWTSKLNVANRWVPMPWKDVQLLQYVISQTECKGASQCFLASSFT